MVQLIQFHRAGAGKVDVQFNVAGASFRTGALDSRTVEITKRIAIATLVIGAIAWYTQAVICGFAVGVFGVISAKGTPKQAQEIFNKIIHLEAPIQLGIALAAYFVTPLVVFPAAALAGALTMDHL